MKGFLGIIMILITQSVMSQAVVVVKKINDTFYIRVQSMAEFPGGDKAWKKYLAENIDGNLGNKYIKIARGETEQTVSVELIFNIDTTGYPSDIVVTNLKDVPSKLADEAIRVIKNSPRWEPNTEYLVPGSTPLEVNKALEDFKKMKADGYKFKKAIFPMRVSISFINSR